MSWRWVTGPTLVKHLMFRTKDARVHLCLLFTGEAIENKKKIGIFPGIEYQKVWERAFKYLKDSYPRKALDLLV